LLFTDMMRVLIVDDEESLRKLLQHWVEAAGATTIEAGTAEEGLALAQSGGAPAVALCDIRLPVNLAMALRVSEPQLSERAALLHNLGRLALPDQIRSSFARNGRSRKRSARSCARIRFTVRRC
jgi:CheY-like chemotaxis protein